MSLERHPAYHFDVRSGAGRSGGAMEARNRGGRERERRVVSFPRSDAPGESGPVSLSVVSAVMTRLLFALQLVGSSWWRG